jgi:hypothetical protein
MLFRKNFLSAKTFDSENSHRDIQLNVELRVSCCRLFSVCWRKVAHLTGMSPEFCLSGEGYAFALGIVHPCFSSEASREFR